MPPISDAEEAAQRYNPIDYMQQRERLRDLRNFYQLFIQDYQDEFMRR